MTPFGTGWLTVAFGVWCVMATGCQRKATPSADRVPANPRAPAAYPPVTNTNVLPPSLSSAPLAPGNELEWARSSFALVQTELSPAILLHAGRDQLSLFAGTTNAGLGAPTYVAWSTANGPRTFKRGEDLDVALMQECWVLVWWAGAEGWTNWDSPWVVYLQHRPKTMRLDHGGLHLRFAGPAGDVVLLPLYGYEKFPQRGSNVFAQFGPRRKVQTWDWPEVLKRDPLTRIRYWAALSRELPIAGQESTSVDAGQDSVTLRWRFQRHRIADDWRTPALKISPLPPLLAHAAILGGFPVRFSKPWFDLDFFTPNGPYVAVEGAEEVEATFSVLQYITETEAKPGLVPDEPATEEALRIFKRAGSAEAMSAMETLEFSQQWPILLRALPLCDATLRSNLAQRCARQLRAQHPDAMRVSLPTWWAYAHFTEDWALVKERWSELRRSFTAARQAQWARCGAEGPAQAGAGAASAVALARLAYRLGDMDAYRDGCAQVARELTLLFVRQRGVGYVAKYQPWHSLTPLGDEAFLDDLEHATPARPWAAGWRIDGPTYPTLSATRAYPSRWTGFADVDLGRFYRDYLGDQVKRELNWFQHRANGQGTSPEEERSRRAWVQVRSLILNESPVAWNGQLVATNKGPVSETTPDLVWDGMTVLRSERPLQFQRLIPPTPVSALQPEPEPEPGRPSVGLQAHLVTWARLASAASDAGASGWPELIWPAWATPTGAPWTFGRVQAGDATDPIRLREQALNRTTRMLRTETPAE